jgi:hypothetical protein
VGRWQGIQSNVQVISSGITIYNETDNNFEGIVEFKNDGTVTLTRDGQISNGTYEVNDKELVTTLVFDASVPNLGGTFTIETLTPARLELYIEKDGTTNIPNVGSVSGTVKGTVMFERIP